MGWGRRGINKSLGHRLWINGSLNTFVFNLSMKLIKTEDPKLCDNINLECQPPNSVGSWSEGDVLDEHVEMYSNSYH